MFKNKHFIAALIITPILAIIAYFAVDYVVTEKPHVAQEGESYPLVSKPNCRYTSGVCEMVNADVKLRLELSPMADGFGTLQLNSSLPLQWAKLSISANDGGMPKDLTSINDSHDAWTLPLYDEPIETYMLRLAVSINGTVYYGEAPQTFFNYKVAFDDNPSRDARDMR